MITTGVSELIVFVWHYVYAKKKMKIAIRIFTKQNVTYLILGMLFIPLSLIIKKITLPFIVSVGLTVASCSLLYIVVLYIKKDNNLMFILSKLKGKVKVNKYYG